MNDNTGLKNFSFLVYDFSSKDNMKGMSLNLYLKTISEVFSKKQTLFLFMGLYTFRFILAAVIPLGSDEAYYWDWGRDLQLSYYDHPPFVAWISWAGQQLLPGKSYFEGRILVPFMHFLTSLNLIFTARQLSKKALTKSQLNLLILAIQIAPIMNLGGMMLMPDSGLMLWLSTYFSICSYYLVYNKKVTLLGAIYIGLTAGLSFTSKYHGIAMVGSSGLYLMFVSKKFRSPIFLLTATFSFMLAASPVLIWNYLHDFVSLGFQMRHGFAEPSFHLIWGLRLSFAELILCTPLVIFALIKAIMNHIKNPVVGFLAAGSLPLLMLFFATSFYKEVLPHWPLPCIIMLSPVLTLYKPAIKTWIFWSNIAYSAMTVGVLSLALGIGSIRNMIPQYLNNRPGALGELTLWTQLIPVLDKYKIWHRIDKAAHNDCQKNPLIGSFRWFWVAQLALNAPTDIKVYSFDQNHISYYNFRDKDQNLSGCRVILVGEEAHIDMKRLKETVLITREESIQAPGHLDRPIKIIWGQLNKNSPTLKHLPHSLSNN